MLSLYKIYKNNLYILYQRHLRYFCELESQLLNGAALSHAVTSFNP